MSIELFVGPANELPLTARTAAGRLAADNYLAIIHPDAESLADALSVAPGTDAFAQARDALKERMAAALVPNVAAETVALLASATPDGQIDALAMIKIVRGTRQEPAHALAGCPDSSLPSSRTYAGWTFPPGMPSSIPEADLAEFCGHVRHLQPRRLVAAGVLTGAEARFVTEHAADAVLVAAYRHELRRRHAPIAFLASTSPRLTKRDPLLAPLFLPLFNEGVALTPAIFENLTRFDLPIFVRWPAVLRRAVPEVDHLGICATIRALAHDPRTRWEDFPELCLPYLIRNDRAFAAVIDAFAGQCLAPDLLPGDAHHALLPPVLPSYLHTDD